jgi:MraZ protein
MKQKKGNIYIISGAKWGTVGIYPQKWGICMFYGEYNHNIDDKGRMSIPSKFREELGDKFYVTKGLDQCLFVFPVEEWKIFQNKLKDLPLTKSNARKFNRFFNAGAMDYGLDKQGRINITPVLRKHAFIEKEVVVIGVGTRMEIWSKDAWEDYNSPENMNYDEIAEQMEELGI